MSEILREFFKTQHGKQLLKTAATKKEAYDQDSYYEGDKTGPTRDEIAVAHPGGGENTQVSNSGGGGEGLYDVSKSDVKATGPCADAHVETVSERAPVVEEVARKAPTGVQGKSDIKGLSKSSDSSCTKDMKKQRKQKQKGKKANLEKLADIANALDEKGLTEEADIIDAIIQEESGAEPEAPEAIEE